MTNTQNDAVIALFGLLGFVGFGIAALVAKIRRK